MSLKKPAVLLAGACALAVAGCSSGASTPPAAGESGPGAGVPQSAPGGTASSLPAGDADTALTPKGGQSGEGASGAPSRDDDPARLVVIVVHLQEGADREATLASINEAVAGTFPGASVTVEREYRNVFQGYALRAPAGSLDAIRAVSGVKLAAIEGEMRVQ
ncbi:hypothetical protein [Actinomyces sp.]